MMVRVRVWGGGREVLEFSHFEFELELCIFNINEVLFDVMAYLLASQRAS